MLVLSRKVNQQIQIGPEIVVTVISVAGSQVRLGIEAPQHVRVYRREVLQPPAPPAAPPAETPDALEAPATTTPAPEPPHNSG